MPRPFLILTMLVLSLSSALLASIDLASEPARLRHGTIQTADTSGPAEPSQESPQLLPRPPAERETTQTTIEKVESAPVIIAGDTLFYIYGNLGPFTPLERARKATDRIEILISSRSYMNTPISLREAISTTEIVAGDLVIHSITNEDARIMGGLRQEIAGARAQTIYQIVERERARRNPRTLLLSILFTALATVALLALWRVITRLAHRTKDHLVGRHVLSFGPLNTLTPGSFTDRRSDAVIIAVKSARILFQLSLLFAYLTIVTGFFYATQGVHVSMNRQLQVFVDWAGPKFVAFLPQLFIIATIVTVTYIIVQFTRLVFVGLGRGTIRWPGFRPEWAQPTYRIISLMLVLFAMVMLWPHLPGSQSPVFSGIAIAVGVILVLGSTLIAANWIAGLIFGYSPPFRVGDYVRIAGTTGEVVGWSLLATRVRTNRNVEVTIPNALAIMAQIVNFSRPGASRNLVLRFDIAVSSAVPWSRAHELLMEAALQTPRVLKEPPPYVIQKQLTSDLVTYELNLYTNDPAAAQFTQSDLYKNLQEVFRAADIPIHSTSYGQSRDSALGERSASAAGAEATEHPRASLLHRIFRHETPLPDQEDLPD